MLDRVLHLARHSAYASGIRSTAGPVVPLLIGLLTGQPGLGLQVAIGGLLVSFTDAGGANRRKAPVMLAATLGGAITCLIGTLAGTATGLAVTLMFAVAFFGAMAAVFGSRAAMVGTTITMAFVFRLNGPNTLDAALVRAAGFIIGGLWAMALSLWLWPTQPFQLAAEAIEVFYRKLAVFIGAVGAHGEATSASPVPDPARNAVEAAHTQARNAILAVRESLHGQSAIGQRLIMLSSSGEGLFHAAVALSEEIAIASTRAGYGALAPKLRAFAQLLANATERIAAAVAAHGGAVDAAPVNAATRDVADTVTALMRSSSDLKTEFPGLVDLRNLARACAYACACVQNAIDAVRVKSGDERVADGADAKPLEPGLDMRAIASKVRANLTFRSLPFRHALRLAVTAGAGVLIYKLIGLDHGYWLPLAIVMIMKPDFGGTRQRAAQAALGTVIGGTIATALSLLITNNYVQVALMIPLGLVAFAAMPRSYVVYTVLFTPFFIMMIDIVTPGDWQLGLERIAYMTGGAILSVLAANLLLPSWERERLPQQLSKTIGANRAFLSAVLSAYINPPGDRAAMRPALEQANVENVNAAASFQRLISEPKSQQGNIASAYALVTYNQRFFDGVTALLAYLREFSGKASLPGLTDVAKRMDDSMSQLSEALRAGRPVAVAPALDQGVRELDLFVQQLAGVRAGEVAAGQADSASRQTLFDFSPVQSELARLAQDIAAMVRLEAQMTSPG